MFEKLKKDFDEKPVRTFIITGLKIVGILIIVGLFLRISGCIVGCFPQVI